MKELVALLEDLGCRNVRTYIQSGNAVFESQVPKPAQLATAISAEVNQRRGFQPVVLILTVTDLAQAIAHNPFPEAAADPKTLHVGFLASAPHHPAMEKLESLRTASERYQLIGSVFYLHAPEGVGQSKLAASSEKLLGVPMTDRNWNTVSMLMQLVEDKR